MKLADKKRYLKSVKDMVASDCPWIVKCYQNPGGTMSKWHTKVIGAALSRVRAI